MKLNFFPLPHTSQLEKFLVKTRYSNFVFCICNQHVSIFQENQLKTDLWAAHLICPSYISLTFLGRSTVKNSTSAWKQMMFIMQLSVSKIKSTKHPGLKKESWSVLDIYRHLSGLYIILFVQGERVQEIAINSYSYSRQTKFEIWYTQALLLFLY